MANFKSLSFLLLHGLLGQLGVTGHPRSPMPAEFQAVVQGPNHEARRREMVEGQLRERGIRSHAVLSAMGKVPRHRFVPSHLGDLAYRDDPLPIGQGQTISQPYIVALMTELIEPRKQMRVLEIGTGSAIRRPYWRNASVRWIRSRWFPSWAEPPRACFGSWVIARCTRESATGTRAGPSALRSMRSCLPPRAGAYPRALAGSAQGWWPPRGSGWTRGPGSCADHADRERLQPRGHRAGAVRADDGQSTAGTLTGIDGAPRSRLEPRPWRPTSTTRSSTVTVTVCLWWFA